MQHTLLLNSVNFFTAKIKVIALNMTFIIKNFKIQTSLLIIVEFVGITFQLLQKLVVVCQLAMIRMGDDH